MSGSILLGAVAALTETIEINCRACPRHGVPRTDRLLAEHGEAMPMQRPQPHPVRAVRPAAEAALSQPPTEVMS